MTDDNDDVKGHLLSSQQSTIVAAKNSCKFPVCSKWKKLSWSDPLKHSSFYYKPSIVDKTIRKLTDFDISAEKRHFLAIFAEFHNKIDPWPVTFWPMTSPFMELLLYYCIFYRYTKSGKFGQKILHALLCFRCHKVLQTP